MKKRKTKAPLLRYLFSLSSGIVVFLLVGFDGIVSVPTETFSVQASTQKAKKTVAVPKKPFEPVYSVVSPLGDYTVKMFTMVPRLNTLTGKTVCMVWNHAFKADVTLPAIGEALKKQYPGVKIVPFTDMPVASLPEPPGAPRNESEALQAAFKEKGCNAVISGNGG